MASIIGIIPRATEQENAGSDRFALRSAPLVRIVVPSDSAKSASGSQRLGPQSKASAKFTGAGAPATAREAVTLLLRIGDHTGTGPVHSSGSACLFAAAARSWESSNDVAVVDKSSDLPKTAVQHATAAADPAACSIVKVDKVERSPADRKTTENIFKQAGFSFATKFYRITDRRYVVAGGDGSITMPGNSHSNALVRNEYGDDVVSQRKHQHDNIVPSVYLREPGLNMSANGVGEAYLENRSSDGDKVVVEIDAKTLLDVGARFYKDIGAASAYADACWYFTLPAGVRFPVKIVLPDQVPVLKGVCA